MRDVYIIGSYTTAFKKHPGMSFGDLAREAYLGTLSDAGMKTGADIEAILQHAHWLGAVIDISNERNVSNLMPAQDRIP